MTLSARALLMGCFLFLGGDPSHGFVIPSGSPTLLSSKSTTGRGGPLAKEGTGAAALVQPGALTSLSGARRRNRMVAGRPGGAGGQPPIMSTGSGGDGGKSVGKKEDSPVDAELSNSNDLSTAVVADGRDSSIGGGAGGATAQTGDPATRSALKQKLLRKVATLNRGFVAGDSDRLDVEEIIEMLEMENPNPNPCEAFPSGNSPLAGRWQLLYTTSLDVLSLQVNPTVTVGKIFQEIAPDGRAIQNIIELQPPFASVNKILGSSMATLTVKLETEPVTGSRINLKFVRTEIKADSIFGRKLDLPTLGVNIPSTESLERLIPGGRSGAEDLRDKVQDVRKKATDFVRKAKDKSSSVKKDIEERIEEEVDGGAGKPRKEGVVDAEVVVVEGESTDNGEGKDDFDDDGSPGGKVEEEDRFGDKDFSSVSTSSSSSSFRKPYFESTYCDEDLRVGRTGQGDVFVSIRA